MTKDTAAPKAKAAAQAAEVQAEGLSVYRVFWLFLMASFLGDLIEVVFWLVTRGELISRSSLVYGPFSLVWGFGAVLLTLVFHKLQDQGNIQIFLLAPPWGACMSTYAPGFRNGLSAYASGTTATCLSTSTGASIWCSACSGARWRCCGCAWFTPACAG